MHLQHVANVGGVVTSAVKFPIESVNSGHHVAIKSINIALGRKISQFVGKSGYCLNPNIIKGSELPTLHKNIK